MKIITILVTFLVFSGLSAGAAAETWDIGADVMFLTTEMTGNTSLRGEETNTTALQLGISDAVTDDIDMEGVIGFGLTDDEFGNCAGTGCSNQLSTLPGLLGIYGKVDVDILPGVNIYGKAGLARLEFEDDLEKTESDIGFAFVIGGVARITDFLALVLEYNQLPDVELPSGAAMETTAVNLGLQTSL